MKEQDNFTPFDYLQMVENQMPTDKTPGKAKTVEWLIDIRKQLDKTIAELESQIQGE